jgi:hypothetical protein
VGDQDLDDAPVVRWSLATHEPASSIRSITLVRPLFLARMRVASSRDVPW